MTVRQTSDTTPAEPLETAIADAVVSRLSALQPNSVGHLLMIADRVVAYDDDLAYDVALDRHACLEPVDLADLFNDRADAAAGKRVVS